MITHNDAVTGLGDRVQLTDSAASQIIDLLEQKLTELLREEVVVQACYLGGIHKLSLALKGRGHKYRTWCYSTEPKEVPKPEA